MRSPWEGCFVCGVQASVWFMPDFHVPGLLLLCFSPSGFHTSCFHSFVAQMHILSTPSSHTASMPTASLLCVTGTRISTWMSRQQTHPQTHLPHQLLASQAHHLPNLPSRGYGATIVVCAQYIHVQKMLLVHSPVHLRADTYICFY